MKQHFEPIATFLLHNIEQLRMSALYSSLMSAFGLLAVQAFSGVKSWMLENNDYIYWSFGLVVVAHVCGSITHKWYKKDFDWKKNILGYFIMLFLVLCSVYISEGFAHIVKEDNLIYMYVKMTGRIITAIYPIRSAYKNMKIISNGDFKAADGMIKKIDRFQETGDLNEFRDKSPNNYENYQTPSSSYDPTNVRGNNEDMR